MLKQRFRTKDNETIREVRTYKGVKIAKIFRVGDDQPLYRVEGFAVNHANDKRTWREAKTLINS